MIGSGRYKIINGFASLKNKNKIKKQIGILQWHLHREAFRSLIPDRLVLVFDVNLVWCELQLLLHAVLIIKIIIIIIIIIITIIINGIRLSVHIMTKRFLHRWLSLTSLFECLPFISKV